jgi:hypothetical protein
LVFCKLDGGSVKIGKWSSSFGQFALAQLDCGASENAWYHRIPQAG